MEIFLPIIFVITLFTKADAACTWPDRFASSTWRDSKRGDVVFTSTTMSGWKIEVDTSSVNNWECHTSDLFQDTGGHLIALSTETFTKFTVVYYSYMCMELTKVNDYLYYYYLIFGTQDNANYERLYIDQVNTVTDFNTICTTGTRATGAEFSVLVRKDSEALAKEPCPAPLLGKFDYTHTAADSTTTCDSSTDLWDVCSDRSKITIDYALCATKVLNTANGTSWCMASVEVGTTWFVSVYNGYDDPLPSGTYRFSCIAVDTDGTVASIAPLSCRENQTPTTLPQETTVVGTTQTTSDIGGTVTLTSQEQCPPCTWPDRFASTTWRDSKRGDVVFASTTMSGWTLTVDSFTVNNWECHTSNLFQDTGGYMVAISTEPFEKSGVVYYAYMCMQLTKVNDYLYYYYLTFATQDDANYERLYIDPRHTILDFNTVCTTSARATGAEFNVLVLKDSEALAKQPCPAPLLGKFDYTHTAVGPTITCDSSEDMWDVCTDNNQMTLDYTLCTTQVLNTVSGISWCMASVEVGTSWFVSVYNGLDSDPLASGTERFSCIAVDADGTKASIAPLSCRESQTPDAFPQETTVAGTTKTTTDIGATATLSSYELCPLNPVTQEEEDKPNAGLIAGLTVGLLFAVVLIVLGICALKMFVFGKKTFTMDRNFSKSPTKSTSSSSSAPASASTDKRREVVCTSPVYHFPPEGLERQHTILSQDTMSPVPPAIPPTHEFTPRYDSPLPQQILTPRNPTPSNLLIETEQV